ncbi:MAG TPA: Asp-tRNA(Asn)/Glu-tRNA(Gln) amidotransferase subunit GatC [Bacteroidota bacterium]|nr:Asp-tRNA(Asn)/Glu-tRNA(Gln) amidotransferase subunit GatC [Bacteroidota bacterium]
MAVTIKDVEHVAALARLEFTPEEKQKLASELNVILAYMEQLNSIDTSGVEPLAHVIEHGNVLRPDEPRASLTTEEALRNAPATDGRFFRVPKVIGER